MAEEGGAPGGQSSGPGAGVIIIKKKKKGGHHGHHGGAWKIAYADFVTAMMAFFLLLWLLATTTKEQKTGIAHYFNPPSNSSQYGGGSGIMGGDSPVAKDAHGATDAPVSPPKQNQKENDDLAAQAQEDALFQQITEQIKQMVMNIPQLNVLLDNMVIDITPEGLRLQLSDSKDRPLFEEGSAKLMPYTQQMFGVLANVLGSLPNQLAVEGHTDVVPYRGVNPAYTNWELSADRAQATRKVLVAESIPERRIGRISGKAAQEPLLRDEPENVRNRRIAVIVLRSKKGTVAAFNQQGLISPPVTGPGI
jgi:chemotaxis protein MotB